MNTKEELSVYGCFRQNFERKCLIQDIILTIVQFYMNDGGLLSVCGDGDHGRLGIEEFYSLGCKKPTRAQAVKDVVDIAAANEHQSLNTVHSSALTENGALFMWGCNGDGECRQWGVGEQEEIRTPTMLRLKEKVSVIECGHHDSLLITMNNLLYSFGSGMFGQLEHGTNKNKYAPTLIDALKDVKIIKVASRGYHILCVDDDFNVWAFGNKCFVLEAMNIIKLSPFKLN